MHPDHDHRQQHQHQQQLILPLVSSSVVVESVHGDFSNHPSTDASIDRTKSFLARTTQSAESGPSVFCCNYGVIKDQCP
jgi:hypothetical protein